MSFKQYIVVKIFNAAPKFMTVWQYRRNLIIKSCFVSCVSMKIQDSGKTVCCNWFAYIRHLVFDSSVRLCLLHLLWLWPDRFLNHQRPLLSICDCTATFRRTVSLSFYLNLFFASLLHWILFLSLWPNCSCKGRRMMCNCAPVRIGSIW